ncbi:hypothetical protein QCA50_019990 [Cerrena zonata]|uniref:Uncharacterized protein n=1 Tax=Cerrena zonata TaxID=2478898 RepID=A0AAW0F8A9_9APHY
MIINGNEDWDFAMQKVAGKAECSTHKAVKIVIIDLNAKKESKGKRKQAGSKRVRPHQKPETPFSRIFSELESHIYCHRHELWAQQIKAKKANFRHAPPDLLPKEVKNKPRGRNRPRRRSNTTSDDEDQPPTKRSKETLPPSRSHSPSSEANEVHYRPESPEDPSPCRAGPCLACTPLKINTYTIDYPDVDIILSELDIKYSNQHFLAPEIWSWLIRFGFTSVADATLFSPNDLYVLTRILPHTIQLLYQHTWEVIEKTHEEKADDIDDLKTILNEAGFAASRIEQDGLLDSRDNIGNVPVEELSSDGWSTDNSNDDLEIGSQSSIEVRSISSYEV